jgi:hypothetical protein
MEPSFLHLHSPVPKVEPRIYHFLFFSTRKFLEKDLTKKTPGSQKCKMRGQRANAEMKERKTYPQHTV